MGVHYRTNKISKNLRSAKAWFLKLKRAEKFDPSLLKDTTHMNDVCEAIFDCRFFENRIRKCNG